MVVMIKNSVVKIRLDAWTEIPETTKPTIVSNDKGINNGFNHNKNTHNNSQLYFIELFVVLYRNNSNSHCININNELYSPS
jgi:hypothetical protein